MDIYIKEEKMESSERVSLQLINAAVSLASTTHFARSEAFVAAIAVPGIEVRGIHRVRIAIKSISRAAATGVVDSLV